MEQLKEFLMWCSIINIGIMFLWGMLFLLARDWMYDFHGRIFKMERERFNAIHYAGLAFYKIIVFVFNIVPLIALIIMEKPK